MFGITTTHRFDAAHRVPVIGGKCLNLHGHTWKYDVTITSPELESGMVVEFGEFKVGLRAWVDENLDHSTLLSSSDPLIGTLAADGTRLYRFGAKDPTPPEKYASALEWPTAESLAAVLVGISSDLLVNIPHPLLARISRVTVQETPSNYGFWEDDRI